MRRTAVTLGATAAVAGGLALGFLAERRFLHPRLEPAPPDPAAAQLGSIAGDLRVIDGPDGLPVTVETYGPKAGAGAGRSRAASATGSARAASAASTTGSARAASAASPADDVPQLVLSHGWICTGRVWHEQVRGLADRYRIVTYDQPGHGRTPAPESGEYDLDLLGDTLNAVVEQAAGPGPIVLVGHSLGGMSLLNAVDRHRESLDERVAGVVLLSTTSRARPERFTFEFGLHAVAQLEQGIRRVVPRLRSSRVSGVTGKVYGSTSDLSTLIVRAMAVGPEPDPRVVEFVEQMRATSDPDMVLGLAEAILGADVDAGLARLHAEVSIVVGSHDRLTPRSLSERMAEVSGAELIELPGIGHMAPLEAGDEVNAILERHLLAASRVDHPVDAPSRDERRRKRPDPQQTRRKAG